MSAAPSPPLSLRPAVPEDFATLARWDEEPHIVESDPNDDWGWEVELQRQPAWREQWIAEAGGLPIGFVQIIDPSLEDSHYWGPDVPDHLRAIDLWIGEPAWVGRGYGTLMMQAAIDHCFSDPAVTAILIDPLASNTGAHRFYERFGFQFVEVRRFGLDDCFVYRLARPGSRAAS